MIQIHILTLLQGLQCCPGFNQRCTEVRSESACEAIQNSASLARTTADINASRAIQPIESSWQSLVREESRKAYVIECELISADEHQRRPAGLWHKCEVAFTIGECIDETSDKDVTIETVFWPIHQSHTIDQPEAGAHFILLLGNFSNIIDVVSSASKAETCSQ
jgi:hypothetical protein